MDNLNLILCSASDSCSAIRSLYQHHKKINPKFSIGYLCSKANIPSRGYLHDVMKGKRRLTPKYGPGLVKAFSLSKHAAKCFLLFIDFEAERSLEKREKILGALTLQKKIISSISNSTIGAEMDHLFCFKVFASFGLFQNKPTEIQIRKLFGQAMNTKVTVALTFLERENLIKRQSGKLVPNNQNYIFGNENSWLQNYIKESLTHAHSNVDKWVGHSDDSIFVTNFISVNRRHYTASLKKLREFLEEFQTELESDDADEVIQFSIQTFPLALK